MKEVIINRIDSAINTFKHLVHVCPDATEIIEEQIANLEQVEEDIKLWMEDSNGVS